ncbi:Syntaxin 6 [Macleaya cordata]|uniref:Syntaxin 6 n=1 Tax=Macleaya cordata TaxID=56857 RepID=A0A200R2X9_MACCD|nr:Syntaxin 6 [Macleaya cordata]
MATNFDRWEKDPFFSAAEEVQESADRMESAYRTWLHESKDSASICDPDELRRDLHTALGTAKWQLDEFERAVRSSYGDSSAKDAKTRHGQFIVAIGNQISIVENSLKDSALAEGKPALPWVRLDEGERDELALFLSGPSTDGDRIPATNPSKDEKEEGDSQVIQGKEGDTQGTQGKEGDGHGTQGMTMPECSKNSSRSAELDTQENKEERLHGHRRTASASADIGSWKIGIVNEDFQQNSLNVQPNRPPPRILSFSGLLNTVELTSKNKWSKNGRKWKAGDCHQAEDALPLRTHQLTRGIDVCYERSKSCLDSCDDSYDKQLYGWLGVVQRQLQRSQYQIQYSRPVQVAIWIVLVLCLIGMFTLTQTP